VPAGPPVFCYPLLPNRRCAEAYAHPFPLSSHSPSMVSLRMADYSGAIPRALLRLIDSRMARRKMKHRSSAVL
jgi:hypothetical protein